MSFVVSRVGDAVGVISSSIICRPLLPGTLGCSVILDFAEDFKFCCLAPLLDSFVLTLCKLGRSET